MHHVQHGDGTQINVIMVVRTTRNPKLKPNNRPLVVACNKGHNPSLLKADRKSQNTAQNRPEVVFVTSTKEFIGTSETFKAQGSKEFS